MAQSSNRTSLLLSCGSIDKLDWKHMVCMCESVPPLHTGRDHYLGLWCGL